MRNWIKRNRLFLIGLGLMIANNGTEGLYMSFWQPDKWGWLGIILNFMSDAAVWEIASQYAKMQRVADIDKRKKAKSLLWANVASVAFAWFFGWRQLRVVLVPIEGQDAAWVSMICAAFVPLVLMFIGRAHGLRNAAREDGQENISAGHLENLQTEIAKLSAIVKVQEQQIDHLSWPIARLSDWRLILSSLNGNGSKVSEKMAKSLLTDAELRPPSERNLARWIAMAREK